MTTKEAMASVAMEDGRIKHDPEIGIMDAVCTFTRMIGCEEDWVIGFTAEPGRLVVCLFLPSPDNPTEKMVTDEGIPIVGDYAADFSPGSSLSFVEGSSRPITGLLADLTGDDQGEQD